MEGRLALLHLLSHGAHFASQPAGLTGLLGRKIDPIVTRSDSPCGLGQTPQLARMTSGSDPGTHNDESDTQEQ